MMPLHTSSDGNPLLELRDPAKHPTMKPESALAVLFLSPERRGRLESSDPGTLESFAIDRLPAGVEYRCLVAACLARLMANPQELPEVRIAAAESFLARDPAIGKALILVMEQHPSPAVHALAREMRGSHVGAASNSATLVKVADAIAGVIFSADADARSDAFAKLGRVAAHSPLAVAATLATLCVEGIQESDRSEGIRLLCQQVPEAIPFFRLAA